MHRNFFLFKRQITEIESSLLDHKLIKCFTHRKDELVLHFGCKKEYFLRICINKNLPYLLLYNPQSIKSPHIQFFEVLKESKVSGISIIPFDKLIQIKFGNYLLECTFFGHSPNITLIDPDGNSIDQFKKVRDSSRPESARNYIDPYSISKNQLTTLINRYGDLTTGQFITRVIAGFNTLLARELAFRCSIDLDALLTSLKQNQLAEFSQNLKNMVDDMNHDPAVIYEKNDMPYHLSIIKMKHLNEHYQKKTFASLNEAWKYFINYFQITRRFNNIQSISHDALKRRIRFLENALLNLQQSEDIAREKKLTELKGNLLLTFANEIQKGSTEVTLKNLFSDSPPEITIELDPKKSITDNAQTYFNKFKDIERTKAQMNIRKRTYESELIEHKQMTDQLTNIRSIKEMLKIHQKLITRGIIQKPSEAKRKSKPNTEVFRHALLDNNWEVFVGRNARNNDMLTFKFAGKFDLWFHAQGVSGSHVVLRRQNKNLQPPKNILLQAAQIAAYYSDARGNSTVPVIITQVRYVRKPRKAAPGLVTTTNTETIFVTPKNLI